MIDDMDSIIFNNIEKIFDNNINTKQINKNIGCGSKGNLNPNANVNMHKNNKINLINLTNNRGGADYNRSINTESGILDETESFYYENENNVYFISSNKNRNYHKNNNVNRECNFSSHHKKNKNAENNLHIYFEKRNNPETYNEEEHESIQIGNSIVNESDVINSYCKENYNNKIRYNNSSENKKYDNMNPEEEFNNNNNNKWIKNSNLFKTHKIQNSKYINTNLNKEKDQENRNFIETNGENTIKFGMLTEFRDNKDLGESFMSSNMGDIAKTDVTIKHSNN